MLELIRKTLAGKRTALLGFGREGQSSYEMIRRALPLEPLIIADANPAVASHPALEGDPNLQFFTGEAYLEVLNHCDLVVKSPGVRINHIYPSCAAKEIVSQTSLFLERFGSQVTGVTGTKGKSTTSSLIHHIMKTAGRDTCLVGNIGSPAFHFIDRISAGTSVVFELSSHQLEYMHFSPHIAVLLNFFKEHLDAYPSYEAYREAKLNITRYQDSGDFLVYHVSDPLLEAHLAELTSSAARFPFSLDGIHRPGTFIRDRQLFFSDGKTERMIWPIEQKRYLRGEHNLKNIMAAVAACCISGIPDEAIREGILTFKGLEHRLEYVGMFRGIHFYNDSIATIPEAAIEAVRSVPDVDTLVLGGFDRGIDYGALAAFIARTEVRNVILLGAAGKRIGECFDAQGPHPQTLHYINRFEDFAPLAFKHTKPGHACLLSPAAASYDEFANFEERGKRFRALVSGKGVNDKPPAQGHGN
jgi:UDP-N-acetylmuramoylalanine--D-glutamate ligase